MFPKARRFQRRFTFRDLFHRCLIPVIIGFLSSLVFAAFLTGYLLHTRSSFDKDTIGNNFIDKDLNWREYEALQSVGSIFSKEVLGVLNATTSNLDPLSLEYLRKKNSVESYVSSEGNEDQMVPGFGHGTWIGKRFQMLNDTTEMLSERSLREERRVKRANELMNDDTIKKFEKAAIARSRSVDSAALGNYTIWKNEYRKGKTFEDMLHLMQEQIIMARVYSGLSKMTNNLVLHQELETLLMKLASEEELTDIDQQQSRLLDTVRDMGKILARASEQLYGCKLVTNMLRAMLQTAEDELEYTQTYITFLTQLASKSLPDAIHCLTMRLNLEYYLLPLPMRNFPRKENLENTKLYHYAIFSDNVLATSVVVNSTVMNAKDSSRHVFHLVTDKLNFGAMSMWFLLNPPGEATIHVQRFEDFSWLNASYSPVMRQLESASMKKFYFKTERSESVESGSESLKYRYPKYMSMLNHLRFYIPKIFPKLEKILFLDDDVVVQKDLAPLWSINLKGKVNGAVETCGVTFHRLDTYLNFSDEHISENFDPKFCAWAYGMNIFDLKEWKKNNITETYHFWQDLNENRTLWKLGTLPPGLITFYKLTLALESKWHLLGLGYDKGIDARKIEKSGVIHFNGHMKPWTEMGIAKYQPYWTKYINFDHPYIFSCKLFE
ncbi:putative galacturonosyltransferase 2 [Cardamine amara subsp. amara]|uniref:Hexosyltransferase n=1 Tax=Cardamine amara subsp. amara TaxID=228776 RepID=A0ABD0ZK62_CARAN